MTQLLHIAHYFLLVLASLIIILGVRKGFNRYIPEDERWQWRLVLCFAALMLIAVFAHV